MNIWRWCDLDKMWHVGRYGGRNHVCNIWWLSVKGCEFGEIICPLPLTWAIALTNTTVWYLGVGLVWLELSHRGRCHKLSGELALARQLGKAFTEHKSKIESVQELVLSQVSQPGTQWSVCEVARKTAIREDRQWRIQELKLGCHIPNPSLLLPFSFPFPFLPPFPCSSPSSPFPSCPLASRPLPSP